MGSRNLGNPQHGKQKESWTQKYAPKTAKDRREVFNFFLQDIFKKEIMYQGRTFPTSNGFHFHLKLRETDDGIKLSLTERKGFAT